VARDRQRSKQRRRRASQSGRGGAAGSRARDIGLDDATVDESGLTDTTPAPDPLKNASAEVDQAKAAETGAGRGEPGEEIDLGADEIFAEEDDDLDRAPDEVQEPELAPRGRRGMRAAEGADAPAREPAHAGGNRVIAFLRACVDELRRVQWPDRKHVFQATAVVLGFVLVAGGWLGLMDAIWQPLINAIL
jgi:preprotein translocase SecE subunit